MFGKKNEAMHEETMQAIVGNVIEEGTRFKGDLSTTSQLTIKGIFEGKLQSNNTVVVEEGGLLKGDAVTNQLIVRGTADGEIHCNYMAQIAASGKVSGSLATARLFTEDGSTFDGQLVILQPNNGNTNTEE